MVQLYFLVIIANVLAGLALIQESLEQRMNSLASIGQYLDKKESVRLILGCATILLGVLKLVWVYPGNIVILGDLLTSLSAIFAGMALLVKTEKNEDEGSDDLFAKAKGILHKYRKPIGYAAICTAILHFILPGVVVL